MKSNRSSTAVSCQQALRITSTRFGLLETLPLIRVKAKAPGRSWRSSPTRPSGISTFLSHFLTSILSSQREQEHGRTPLNKKLQDAGKTAFEVKNSVLLKTECSWLSEIPLSDAGLAALDDGVSALESLLGRLANVPTPADPTPLQLRSDSLVQIRQARSDD